MMPICTDYIAEGIQQFRIAAIQGIGIVFLGNFSGMVAGFVLSPQEINVPKVIGSSLFGGLVGIAIAFTLILKKTREFTSYESD
ncbi:hypothetical protein IQ247_09160 [Plectonema cf. radiosum LEGE 06105]|uniref:Uncharacterized protein n=1 Tax=Plectonema cf. radiosum LEGE 06105 TaxID=945769 RepID=A0A8J7F6K0_9CYAN|nr:hypothetical protein [Plectonema radiosum]MBE9212859.1 hypothetical protein [Plectonema cf. radiosum LEGE 06105]